MSFTIKGFLTVKNDEVQVSEKLTTRSFVVEVPGKYTDTYAFQLLNDRCELIDNIAEGTEVEVSFDIKCNAWKDKWFTNLNAWKCVPVGNVHHAASKSEERRREQQKQSSLVDDNEGTNTPDDLPF